MIKYLHDMAAGSGVQHIEVGAKNSATLNELYPKPVRPNMM
jgi:hypothetical protein